MGVSSRTSCSVMTTGGVTVTRHANAESGLLTAACGLHHASLSGNSAVTEQFSKVASAPRAGVRGFRPPRRRIRAEPSATMTSDQVVNRQRVKRLVEKPGNGTCADCGAAGGSGGNRTVSVNASWESTTFLSSDAFRFCFSGWGCCFGGGERGACQVTAGNPGDGAFSSSLAEPKVNI